MLLTLPQTGIPPGPRQLAEIPALDDRPLAVLARAARLREVGTMLLVRDEKEDKTVTESEPGPGCFGMILIVLAVFALLLGAALLLVNPCIWGHEPMADCPQDFTVVTTGDTSVRINICGRKFHVCRRCKLVYLDHAAAEAGKKP